MFFGFLTFIDFEILSVSIFWISFLLIVDLVFIIFSTKVNRGDVLSTVARSEVALTLKSPLGVFNNKKEFTKSIICLVSFATTKFNSSWFLASLVFFQDQLNVQL